MNKELPIPPPLPPAFHRCNGVTFKCNVSKKRTWLPFIVVTILSLILIGIVQPPLILGVFIVLSGIIFFGAFQLLSKTMYRNIEYTIENNILTISHPMRTLTIDICSIKKITRGDLLRDQGGVLMNRRGCDFTASYRNIRILYNKNQYVYISPKDEHGCLRILQEINPNIAFGKELQV